MHAPLFGGRGDQTLCFTLTEGASRPLCIGAVYPHPGNKRVDIRWAALFVFTVPLEHIEKLKPLTFDQTFAQEFGHHCQVTRSIQIMLDDNSCICTAIVKRNCVKRVSALAHFRERHRYGFGLDLIDSLALRGG